MSVCITKLSGTAFLAFPESKNLLENELAERFDFGKIEKSLTISGERFSANKSVWYRNLLFCPDFKREEIKENSKVKSNSNPYWASLVLYEPFLLNFQSIGEAAKSLKEIQRNWAGEFYNFFRRGALIQEKLPYINLKPKKFFKTDEIGKNIFSLEIPHTPMGFFTLIDENTILASAKTSSSIPFGRIVFEEDHENPPSRAYLKLQESLTLFRHFTGLELPNSESKCFEAGACPGGWTWVLKELGAQVFAVDRAELDSKLMKDKLIKFAAHDAFTLKPQDVAKELGTKPVDWVFSDVICYPQRLFEWVNLWIQSGLTNNMICTIKMQGEIDWSLVQKFADIKSSRVLHLNYNKHELTWLWSKFWNNSKD
ncbi:SAM-dependent methyltransferase [Treponema pectinovorum]|uniref:SAM-dependent methyltransferase n=1 Tax=Treponema pectinovorum TaxID=164 RepID=UPI003D92B9E7